MDDQPSELQQSPDYVAIRRQATILRHWRNWTTALYLLWVIFLVVSVVAMKFYEVRVSTIRPFAFGLLKPTVLGLFVAHLSLYLVRDTLSRLAALGVSVVWVVGPTLCYLFWMIQGLESRSAPTEFSLALCFSLFGLHVAMTIYWLAVLAYVRRKDQLRFVGRLSWAVLPIVGGLVAVVLGLGGPAWAPACPFMVGLLLPLSWWFCCRSAERSLQMAFDMEWVSVDR